MDKALDAFLWRRVKGADSATVVTLVGESKGQYDIRLSSKDYTPFFHSLAKENETERGGFDISLPIQPFRGPNSVDERVLIVHFMGEGSRRKDWYIRAQRPNSAYELWREGRGFESKSTVGDNDYIVIARDKNNDFHARWIRSSDFDSIPDVMKEHMITAEAGWHLL
jgi:5-methylcytosine-specific restriction enzyme B